MNFKTYLMQRGVNKDLSTILFDISSIAVRLASAMRTEIKGYAGTENIHGEKQIKMDVLANDLFVDTLKVNPAVALLASEELDEAIDGTGDAYSVAFDPLDGSSLADVNLSVGSIIGIYAGKGFMGKKGSEQVASVIVVYGPRLTFMVSVGQGVDEFTFDAGANEFVLTSEKLQLAPEMKMFAPGNLRATSSEEWYLKLMEHWVKSGYTLRYSGGMVPDVNQILKKGGGVFTYPGYQEKPLGKLRLLYECAPMAFLVEQAGGSATFYNRQTKQSGRILDLEITQLHQTTSIFLGSMKEVELVKGFIR